MKYNNIVKAEFINRPNRFIAECKIGNEDVIVHVKNTGRCKELLNSNAKVFLEYFPETARKTKYDLISVYKGERLINMDSQVPNKVVYEALKNNKNILCIEKPLTFIKMEQKYKQSRFDIYAESGNDKIFIEVKGVTLEENNIAMFPDAPTERGIKHIHELVDAYENGYMSYIIFVIQMEKVSYFTPNYKTHEEFGKALQYASSKGIKILAYDCFVEKDSIILNNKVNIKL